MKSNKNQLPIKKSDNIFVQSNEFIQAKYKDNMSFWELLIFGKMCTMIDPNDTDFKDYKIYIKDLIGFSGVVKGGIVYQYVLEATERLKQREISIKLKNEDDKEETLDTYLVVGRKVLTHREADEDMYVKLTFHPDLKPFLLQLKRDFTKLDIRSYRFLHTSSSIRLYHILKQFYGRKKFNPKIDLQELKEMLGVQDKYNPYNNFKQRILDDSQKRLAKNMDIKFEYEEIKEGKKVIGLIFHIEENEPIWSKGNNSTTDYAVAEVVSPTFFEEIFPKLDIWGMGKEALLSLIDTYSEAVIRQALAYTLFEEQQGKMKENKIGFFINAVKNLYTSPSFEASAKKEQRSKIAKERNDNLAQLKIEAKDLKARYQEEINDKVRQLVKDDLGLTDRAVDAVKQKNTHYFTLKGVNPNDLDIEVFRKDKILRGLVIKEIQEIYTAHFKEIQELYLPKIQDLDKKIKTFK